MPTREIVDLIKVKLCTKIILLYIFDLLHKILLLLNLLYTSCKYRNKNK